MTDTFIELYVQGLDEQGYPDGKQGKLCVNAKDIVFFGVHWHSNVTYIRIQMGYETIDYYVEGETHEHLTTRILTCGTVQISRVTP